VGVEVQLHAFLTAALGSGEWSDSLVPRRDDLVLNEVDAGWTPKEVLASLHKSAANRTN
jgi:hypothetical protein